ncbi:ZYBA0S09-01420g1_1 [Zygosaccharomyces bailii CLIB 213]|uniref:ZYBA0S09-01420g1_1 n=1 Tax=Zygosaccharomyces bailii (strain CLIB 213 / ATCC 58445 / CBS 680 / BCRC 21525 / NBRC 1098 / NCYC 1416 / NRRL Y-2227) TaxID=1333698 RepID=A0A8J2T9R0_ZYGB2|nr:ZYBA0S09-01420g1_1 [Zygosaccharomyces bailii CLIB 213]
MSTSIPVLNRNTQLPPLLLPASRSLERCDPFGKRRPRDQGSDEGLEGLAFLATKRPRLDAVTTGPTPSPSPEAVLRASPPRLGGSRAAAMTIHTITNNNNHNNNNIIITPTTTATTAYTSSASSASSASSSGTSSRSGSRSGVELLPSSRRGSAPAAASPSGASAASAATTTAHRGSSSKRQRTGPSCDGCRLKKIKCDAHVEVLYQGPSVTRLGSDKLRQVVSREQVLAHLPLDIPPSLCQDGNGEESGLLIKHIDKIILFRPCTSCAKRRASIGELQDHAPASPLDEHSGHHVTHVTDAGSVSSGACVFSKGFTRADINVFAKITKRVGQRPVQEMTLQDYRNAGFE